jgi:hypothetical protein
MEILKPVMMNIRRMARFLKLFGANSRKYRVMSAGFTTWVQTIHIMDIRRMSFAGLSSYQALKYYWALIV